MKRMLSIILMLSCVACLFVACTGNSAEETSKSTSTTAKAQDVWKVATNAEFEPFEFKDMTSGKLKGLDIDLVNAICEKLDVKAEFSDMPFLSVVTSVSMGASKIAASGLTITEDRKESVDFSTPYYTVHQVLIVPANDSYFTGSTEEAIRAQLKSKRIGVCSSFTGADYVADEVKPGTNAKEYENISLAIQDLKNGAIDAIVMDDVVAKKAAAQDANKSAVKVLDVHLTVEEYAIVLKKGDAALKMQLDGAINELKDSGKLDEMINTWILA